MKNNYLLINELATLFDVTTHTLRFYEQKGLITPVARTKKGYRLYDFESISRLEEILMCRSIDMPIHDIINYLNRKSVDHLSHHLSRLETQLDKKIQELRDIKSQLKSGQETIDHYRIHKDTFFTQSFDERYLLFLEDIDDAKGFQLSEKDFYHAFLKSSHNRALKLSKDLVFISTRATTKLYLLIHPADISNFNMKDLRTLPKSNYLCHFHVSTSQKDYMKLLSKVEAYLKKHHLTSEDYLIEILSTNYSIMSEKSDLTCMQLPVYNF